jgi:hypothetical protein
VDPLRWPRDTLYPQKLALTSKTRGGHSVGIVLSRTKATEFSLLLLLSMALETIVGTWPIIQLPDPTYVQSVGLLGRGV